MKGHKIVYVDDEKINLDLFKLSIGKHYPVICLESGKEALELIRDGDDIGMLITDMRMPGMNGLELIDKVKKYKNDLPCIILSGYDKTEQILEAIRKKIILDYMIKPFEKKEMINLIEANIV